MARIRAAGAPDKLVQARSALRRLAQEREGYARSSRPRTLLAGWFGTRPRFASRPHRGSGSPSPRTPPDLLQAAPRRPGRVVSHRGDSSAARCSWPQPSPSWPRTCGTGGPPAPRAPSPGASTRLAGPTLTHPRKESRSPDPTPVCCACDEIWSDTFTLAAVIVDQPTARHGRPSARALVANEIAE